MNVLNDPGEQCCKDDGVPSKCLGMCNRPFNDDNKDHVMKDECKKVWNEIKNCQDLTKGIIMIVFTFLSEKLYDIEMMLR